MRVYFELQVLRGRKTGVQNMAPGKETASVTGHMAAQPNIGTHWRIAL